MKTDGCRLSAAKGQQAFALLLVLVLMGSMVVMVLSTQLAVSTSRRAARLEWQRAVLLAQAEQAARLALGRLTDDEDLNVDHYGEEWAQPFAYTLPDGIQVRGTVVDVCRSFDLNNLAAEELVSEDARSVGNILRDLFIVGGDLSSADRIEGLRDWIDQDGEGFREDGWYLEQNLDYGCPNTVLHSWSELRWIAGFTDAWMQEALLPTEDSWEAVLHDSLCVIPVEHAGVVPINVNTALKSTLIGVLGPEYEGEVELLLSMRKDQPVRSLSALSYVVAPEYATKIQPYLDVKSSFFEVQVQAVKGGLTKQLFVLVQRSTDGGLQVINWKYD